MTGEPKPSGICPVFHLRCVFVTSPDPVGSTATPVPPRPLSRYTNPPPSTGETVSPLALHVHSTLPLSGSTPWSALDAAMSSCFLPPISTRTCVLCAKPCIGRGASHFTSPVFLSNAVKRDCLSFSSHWR